MIVVRDEGGGGYEEGFDPLPGKPALGVARFRVEFRGGSFGESARLDKIASALGLRLVEVARPKARVRWAGT